MFDSFDSIGTSRTIVLPAPQTLTASSNARTAQVFGEADCGNGLLKPFVGGSYVNVSTDAFQESGGGAALTVAAGSESVAFTTLGVRTETNPVNGMSLKGMAGWRHAYGDVTPLLAAQIAGNSFTVAGAPIAGDAFVAQAGINVEVSSNATIDLSYVGQIGADTQDHGATGTATIKF